CSLMVLMLGACSNKGPETPSFGTGGTSSGGLGGGGNSGSGGAAVIQGGRSATGGGAPIIIGGNNSGCPKTTCAEIGFACGYTINECGQVVNCAAEGLTCKANEVCIGGVDGPTKCESAGGKACPLCEFI